MAVLIAYFAFVVSTLAVIVTAWIGVAESGAERMHLQRASAIQHSYDASFMADDSGDTGSATAATATAKAPPAAATAANAKPQHWRAHLARRLPSQPNQRLGADPHIALRGLPPPDDGH
jgi:hypothetical protein